MRYQVHGVREVIVSVYVDADSEGEALEKANNEEWDTSAGMDEWDINDTFSYAHPG